MCGGAAAGNGAHSAREETVSDLDDGLPLGAKDGMSRREPEALDASTALRRERHEALRREPMDAELRSTGIAVPLSDSTLPFSTDSRSTAGRPQATAPRFDATAFVPERFGDKAKDLAWLRKEISAVVSRGYRQTNL